MIQRHPYILAMLAGFAVGFILPLAPFIISACVK